MFDAWSGEKKKKKKNYQNNPGAKPTGRSLLESCLLLLSFLLNMMALLFLLKRFIETFMCQINT